LGAVEGIIERLDRPCPAICRRLAAPAPPDLAVADPHRLTVALLDMRGPIAQRRRQPRLPQIRRQLAQIHMVVAGDQLMRHNFLLTKARSSARDCRPSMAVSRCGKRAPFAQTVGCHFPGTA
jgi:hypothetical protein